MKEFLTALNTNDASEYIKQLYSTQILDKLHLDNGIQVKIKVNETYQDFYAFFKIYMLNKHILAIKVYDSIIYLEKETLNIFDNFLYYKYKTILLAGIENVNR